MQENSFILSVHDAHPTTLLPIWTRNHVKRDQNIFKRDLWNKILSFWAYLMIILHHYYQFEPINTSKEPNTYPKKTYERNLFHFERTWCSSCTTNTSSHPCVVKNSVCCSVLQCVAVCYSVLQCVTECYSVLQCVAVYCSVLQCVAVRCSVLQYVIGYCQECCVLQGVVVCCSTMQCVAVCCSVLQCVAVCCRVLQGVAGCCSLLQYDAVWCRVLQGVAICCSVMQWVIALRCCELQWVAV